MDGVAAQKPTPVVDANVIPARANLDGVQSALNAVNARRPTPVVSARDLASEPLGAIQSLMNALNGRVFPTVTVATRIVGPSPAAIAAMANETMGPVGMATGGPVRGPGSGTSDTAGIYALSNGEHIFTAAEVQAGGGHAGIYRLRKALLSGGVQYAATGGPVSLTATPAPMVIRQSQSAQSRPLMGDVTFVAADPREALHEMNMNLRVALAANGLS